MIRLAANTASSSSSSSSAYDSSSSVETPSPVKIEKNDLEESAAVTPLPIEDSGLPIWEDYVPDMQKQLDDLTKAFGNYVAQSQSRPPPQAVSRALLAAASSSSDSESEAPPVASV